MSRGLYGNNQAAAAEALVRPVFFVELSLSAYTLRVWSGLGDVVALGETWRGVGEFFGFGAVHETDDLSSTSVELELDGVDPDQVAIAYATEYQGRPGALYIGFLGDDDGLVADPQPIFAGLINTMADEDDGSTARIGVELVSYFVDHKRRPELRYTDQGQRSLYPTDTGLRFVAALPDRKVTWGRG